MILVIIQIKINIILAGARCGVHIILFISLDYLSIKFSNSSFYRLSLADVTSVNRVQVRTSL